MTEYFQKENPQLKATETELAATNKKIAAIKPPTTLVMVEEDKPRETFIMQRGEYLNPGAKVTATTPEILHGMSADLPATVSASPNGWWPRKIRCSAESP